jgi:hypothetical protein
LAIDLLGFFHDQVKTATRRNKSSHRDASSLRGEMAFSEGLNQRLKEQHVLALWHQVVNRHGFCVLFPPSATRTFNALAVYFYVEIPAYFLKR